MLLLCFASGLEVPQLRALSIAVGDSIAQARALLQPRASPVAVLHHTHPVDLASFVQISMSAIKRGTMGRAWQEDFA